MSTVVDAGNAKKRRSEIEDRLEPRQKKVIVKHLDDRRTSR